MNLETGVKVKCFLAELEDGSLIYRESTVVEKPKAKRGRPRKVQAEPKPKAEVLPEPKAEKKPHICVPLNECAGLLVYTKKDGSDMVVAIYKHGEKKNGTPWYLCLFISRDNQWAYSYSKPWFSAENKIKEIEFFTEEEKIS